MSLKPSILTVGRFQFYSVSQIGIVFAPETPTSEWRDALNRLFTILDGATLTRDRALMLIADALNFGEKAYGKEYQEAIKETRIALGLAEKTVKNAISVYRKVDSSRRREGVSLKHYSVISPMKPEQQAAFIERTVSEKMSVSELKEAVAEQFPKTSRGQTRKAATPDDEQSALQKFTDSNNFCLGRNIDDLGLAWKPQFEIAYKIYRRRWVAKRGTR